MMKTNALMATFTIALLGASGATADTPRIDERQQRQEDRIAQGLQNGELTRRETVRLANGQREFQRMENRAQRDGVVTRGERAALHNKANRESAKIYRSKNNPRTSAR